MDKRDELPKESVGVGSDAGRAEHAVLDDDITRAIIEIAKEGLELERGLPTHSDLLRSEKPSTEGQWSDRMRSVSLTRF